MCFEAALLALVFGILLGGSLKKLLEIQIHALPLLIVSLLMSILPKIPVFGSWLSSFGTAAAVALAVVRYGALIAFAFMNLRYPPVIAIGCGGLLNGLVTLANGGRMPVAAAALGAGTKDASAALLKQGLILNYQVAGSGTRLRFLSDVIMARGFFTYFLSAGDLLVAAGIFALILELMQPKLVLTAAAGLKRAFARRHP